MSQENVEIIRGGYDAFASGDLEAVLDRVDPTNVEWAPAIAPMLGVDTLRGKDELRRFFTLDLFEGFDSFKAEPQSFEDLGDNVLVVVRYTGRGEASGLEIDQTFHTVFSLREKKIVAMRDHSTRSEALEAVGLSE